MGVVVEAGKGLGTKRDRSRNRELGARGEEGEEGEGEEGERSSSFRAPTLQQQDIFLLSEGQTHEIQAIRRAGDLLVGWDIWQK